MENSQSKPAKELGEVVTGHKNEGQKMCRLITPAKEGLKRVTYAMKATPTFSRKQ